MKIETAAQLAEACRAAAEKKTLYVYGAYGFPLHEENKQRILKGYAYNRKPERKEKIQKAQADTFGFDCSGLIKGLLWGWQGTTGKNGGAVYASNAVPDQNADTMIANCLDVSTDFTRIQVGEAVWLPGHIGIYVGDGLAVECTSKWADGVQLTACNTPKEGYPTRAWKKHGKLPSVSYTEDVVISLPVLRRGMSGRKVVALQRLLFAMGYPIGNKNPMDGKFGPKVEAALRSFQQEKGLRVAAETDKATWQALLEV
jgi:hypothetical protein